MRSNHTVLRLYTRPWFFCNAKTEYFSIVRISADNRFNCTRIIHQTFYNRAKTNLGTYQNCYDDEHGIDVQWTHMKNEKKIIIMENAVRNYKMLTTKWYYTCLYSFCKQTIVIIEPARYHSVKMICDNSPPEWSGAPRRQWRYGGSPP